jgi:hypothetical protein
MDSGFTGLIVLLLLLLSAVALLMSRDWRWVLGALGLQYFLAFLLVTSSWPLELAAVKLVAGWMASAILGLTRMNLAAEPEEASRRLPTSPAFLILSTFLVLLVVSGAAPALADWARQMSINQAWGGLILIGLGLLQVGLSGSNFRSVVGLLCLLSGFEILYAAVEASLLVAALLGVLNLAVGLAGSYLLPTTGTEQRE